MRKKECIAMLLAGGQGTRLGLLTQGNAKPAVSFGGKYRIIDFSLSNCVNSGIDTVGVLVQYRPMILNKYLGTGEAWDLDSADGGVHVLPPYATQTGGSWYEGTADAIYHNIDFIDNYDPGYVVILSGDHLYKMDYNLMLQEHKANNADLTISVMEVPWEEASRFGILTANDEGRVVKFSEKPKEPDSNLASMGIYIFSWPVLKQALIEDHEDQSSEKDFGKNIIPKLLKEEKRIFTYKFKGYWKDVGTIQSYFDAHMDLLVDDPEFDIFDNKFKIFSNSNMYPPHMIGPEGKAVDSLICNGATINGTVEHSVIGLGVTIDEDAYVKDSVLLPDVHVCRGAKVERAVINEGSVIAERSSVGSSDGDVVLV
ncbi:MAG: glucose-1-phosphate adenylyltransferase [Firmicutes bacterium]|jgi:glucose-1-phosphate adenylyltransferase|nr:glucose-1-phosphate adenylyltransferase [Bacillota bacterium]